MGTPSDNLYITGLPEGFDDGSLQTIFGAYGTIAQCKLLNPQPGRPAAAMVRFGSVDEAKCIVDNLNGNIPQGLTDAIMVKYAMGKDQQKGDGKGYGGGPYDGGKGGGFGKDGGKGGKGKGKCSIRTLTKGLLDAGALPGGHPQNDENTIFVAGLPGDSADVDLYKMFAPFGPVKGVKAMVDRDTGICKGIGFVHMADQPTCQMAIATLNGTMLPDGSWLTVKIKQEGGAKGEGKGDGKGGKFA